MLLSPSAFASRSVRRPRNLLPSSSRLHRECSEAPHGALAPTRVLPRQLLHQCAHLIRDRRPSRPARAGPSLPEQAPMPGQQGARGHDPLQPKAPGQHPRQGGEHGTVSPVEPRARYLTPQYRDLMPENQDLCLFGSVTTGQQRQPVEHPHYEQVDQRRMSMRAERKAAGQATRRVLARHTCARRSCSLDEGDPCRIGPRVRRRQGIPSQSGRPLQCRQVPYKTHIGAVIGPAIGTAG